MHKYLLLKEQRVDFLAGLMHFACGGFLILVHAGEEDQRIPMVAPDALGQQQRLLVQGGEHEHVSPVVEQELQPCGRVAEQKQNGTHRQCRRGHKQQRHVAGIKRADGRRA